MFEIVPSQVMRQFYNEIGFEFTDYQKATLIWNATEKKRQEILYALKELADRTKDSVTRQQILERLAYEEKLYATFVDNSASEYVYVVEDEEHYSCGFFGNYDRAVIYAVKYAKEYGTMCSIQKQFIVRTAEDETVRNPGKGNPNMGFEVEEYIDYDGTAVSSITLDKNGIIVSLWSRELSKAEEDIVDEFRTDRFEQQFIKIPFNLAIGTPVKDVVSGCYGILAEGKTEWDKYLKRIEEKKLYVDYSDVQVIVYELTESGYWSHKHINPMYLETEFPPYIPDDEKRQAFRGALKAFGDYLRYKESEKNGNDVIRYSKEYAKACKVMSKWEKLLDEAKEPDDIIW